MLATALYGPYGVGRYATGTMPSSKDYTGQRQDSGSGLDYYTARYYDPTLGQFTSGDERRGPNRYGYVGGNPETATDPTGKRQVSDVEGGAGTVSCPVQATWCGSTTTSWGGSTISVAMLGAGGMQDCDSAGCVVRTRHGIVLGQGRLIYGAGDNGFVEYLWGTWQHGDVAMGLSGDSLKVYIGQLQAEQNVLQGKIDAYNRAAKA